MELIELKSTVRTERGNGPARRLRREGKIPAVLYGPQKEPVSLTVQVGDLETALKRNKGSQLLLNLIIQNGGETTRTALLKELQVHPLTRNFIHADFYEIDMNRKIRVSVPVVAVGRSKGVEDGGILQIIRRELEVFCYPNQIPENIEIDVTDLDIGDAVHIEELQAKGDVEYPADVNFTVLTIVGAQAEEAAAEGEEDEEGAIEENGESTDEASDA